MGTVYRSIQKDFLMAVAHDLLTDTPPKNRGMAPTTCAHVRSWTVIVGSLAVNNAHGNELRTAYTVNCTTKYFLCKHIYVDADKSQYSTQRGALHSRNYFMFACVVSGERARSYLRTHTRPAFAQECFYVCVWS